MDGRENEIRSKLLDSVSYVIATDGYFRATTKRIAQHAKLNEAYIYRYYESKEDLIHRSYALNDRNLAELLLRDMPLLELDSIPWEDRCRAMFMHAWDLMISVSYDAKFYVRYYYSEQYRLYSKAEHDACYTEVRKRLAQYFEPGADIRTILRFVFESTICMVFRVASGESDGSRDSVEQQFRLLYQGIRPYFRAGLVGDERSNESQPEIEP